MVLLKKSIRFVVSFSMGDVMSRTPPPQKKAIGKK